MLNRKEFLEKSAIYAGTLTGAVKLITITNNLMADDKAIKVVTDLSFIDTVELGRMMERIDIFGDPGEGRAISSSVFKPGMELSGFAEQYCAEIVKRYKPGPDKNGSCNGITFAMSGDSLLELLQSLMIMAGNSIYAFYVKSIQGINSSTIDVKWAEAAETIRIVDYAANMWKSFITSYNSERLNKVRLVHGNLYARDYQPAFIDTEIIKNLTGWDSWRSHEAGIFFRRKNDYMYDIALQRYLCKAIFSRYSMLASLEKYMGLLSSESEKVYGSNEITADSRQMLNKVLCTLLFLELCLSRMRLIAHRSRSGIFSHMDRAGFQYEFSELAETVYDIAGRPSFGGRKLFGGHFDAKPAQLKSGKLGGHIRVPLVNCATLGIRDKNGRDIISVSTQGNSEWAMTQLDLSLKTINEIKSQVLSGVIS